MELDHDEPPDGEGQREEDGHRVDHHCEVDMEQHEDPPTKRHLGNNFVFKKIKEAFSPFLFWGFQDHSSASCG